MNRGLQSSTEREGCCVQGATTAVKRIGERKTPCVKETKRCLDVNDESCMGKGTEKREQDTKGPLGGFMSVCLYTCSVQVCEGQGHSHWLGFVLFLCEAVSKVTDLGLAVWVRLDSKP